jgi:hypothetical protein
MNNAVTELRQIYDKNMRESCGPTPSPRIGKGLPSIFVIKLRRYSISNLSDVVRPLEVSRRM